MSKRTWILITIFSVVFFGSAAYFTYFYLNDLYPSQDYSASEDSALDKNFNNPISHCQDCVRSKLDGVYVNPGQDNFYPVAVIIDNLEEARPQSGLDQAKIIYEAEAEGSVTRYLAIFTPQSDLNLGKIGPIRSLRPYFLDLANEYSALLVHVGGSPEALAKVAKNNIFNLNEFYKGDYFWRDQGQNAPHNVYTGAENLNRYLSLKEAEIGKFLPLEFKDENLPKEQSNLDRAIEISYNKNYVVKWYYDNIKNEYIHSIAGEDDSDNIAVKNLIIQYVKTSEIPNDDKQRLELEIIGEGSALVCLDGKCEIADWEKAGSEARTRFYHENKEEFKFNAGKIWINLVRPETIINITK